MSEDTVVPGGIPTGEVKKPGRFSIIWIIPIVALIVAAGLAYRTLSERGPLITITFETAEGLEAGKTTLQYRSVNFGIVEEIDLSENTDGVIVHARVSPSAAKHITEGTRFWVVRPRVGASGISGFQTLLSGAYITNELGPPDAAKKRSFKGLDEPPMVVDHPDALRLELTTDALGDISGGSPIYYRNIQVGKVAGYELGDKDQGVTIHLAITHEHANLVTANTHFWNVSGFELDASFSGIEANIGSLRSLISGGISFDTHGAPGTSAKNGDRYSLYEGPKQSKKAWKRSRTKHILVEGKTLGSIREGEGVLYNGVQVGSVLSVELKKDAATIGVVLGIEPEYARLVRTNSRFWNASGISADIGLTGIHVHTASLASLVSGAVAFATPEKPGARAAAGSIFKLHDEPKKEWLKWRPHIWLGKESDRPKKGPVAAKATVETDQEEPELVHHENADPAEKKSSHHWWSGAFHKHKKKK
jgi:paraquat-inducible protein B